MQELRLTETNYNSSQFTSVLDTTSFSTPSLYRFSYKGPVNHAGGGLAEAYVRMIDQPNVSASGADRDVQFFSAGENISVAVFDASANTDSCISDVVLVNINVLNQVDVENVSLLETSHDSSLFTGTISTRVGGLADVVKYNNIVTLTSYSDVLVASYPSAAKVTYLPPPNFPSSSSNTRRPSSPYPLTAFLVQETQSTASDAGSLDPTYPILLAGSTLSISLTDKDVTANTLAVSLSTSKDSEQESATLQKCTSCTTAGTFVGYINTKLDASRGRSYDGVLNVLEGDILTVGYQDQRPRRTRIKKIRVATRGQLSMAPALPALNDYLSITLKDSDLDRNPSLADTVLIFVDKVPVSDAITVTLKEIGLSAGMFTGTLLLSDTNTPNALSGCQAGDTVTVSFDLLVFLMSECCDIVLFSWLLDLNVELFSTLHELNVELLTPSPVRSPTKMTSRPTRSCKRSLSTRGPDWSCHRARKVSSRSA